MLTLETRDYGTIEYEESDLIVGKAAHLFLGMIGRTSDNVHVGESVLSSIFLGRH